MKCVPEKLAICYAIIFHELSTFSYEPEISPSTDRRFSVGECSECTHNIHSVQRVMLKREENISDYAMYSKILVNWQCVT